MDYSNKDNAAFHTDNEKKKGKRKDKQGNWSEYEKNQLLSFQFADYSQPQERYRAPKTKTLSVREKKKLKQNYLQGNFRFFVSPDFDLDIRYMDPNQEIKWDTIVKLKYITNNMIMCPICLSDHYDIKIAKITKCGHIFCWQCIIKYLSYQKPKCPLCEEIVVLDDLRSVQIVHFPVATPGDNIYFKLKKRRKVENTIYDAADFTEEEDFIRIKKIYYDTIKEIKEGEKKILYDELRDLGPDQDLDTKDAKALIEKCLGFLYEEIQHLETRVSHWMPKVMKKHSKEPVEDPTSFNEDEFYYFYQEGSGLNIFLHPIDYKYMRAEYEAVRNFPLVLEASLLEMEAFQHNDQTRKRYKFLDHVPLNSDVKFAQVEMRQFLSTKVYNQLNEEIDRHHQQNKLKEIAAKPHRKTSGKAYQGKQSDDLTTSFPPVQFNPAPSELKLNDKTDYPELGPLQQKSHSTAVEPSWWTKELAPVPFNEKKYSVNQGQPKIIKDDKKGGKKKEEEESYVVSEGSGQMNLGDFITFAQVKKTKKKHR